MTSINYNEFQVGQGVSAPSLNENFTLTNNAIENLEVALNSAVSTLTSATNSKANKNGSNALQFNVATATENNHAVNYQQMNEFVAPLSPAGTVIWYAGSSAPEGYLLCDGSEVSRTTYDKLFECIGVKFGVGDTTSTFNLPDLIGKFIEGSATAGTYKDAGLPNIKGGGSWGKGSNPSGALYTTYTDYNSGTSVAETPSYYLNFDASRSSSVYKNNVTTVQPESLTLLPCIKY